MRKPLIQRRPAQPRSRERGVTMALVALAMVGMISMAALSIDIGTLYQASADAQKNADAAALAAAKVLSLSGMTGDPTNINTQWQQACNAAIAAAQTVVNQNPVGGTLPGPPTITFFSRDGTSCSDAGPVAFGVNPMVTVKVTQPNLSTFFAHIFGLFNNSWRTATVTATATAEVYNPSNSGNYTPSGNIVPVQPRCVKPWIVPNQDPFNPPGCTGGIGVGGTCNPFVNLADGSIGNKGINAFNGGVVGEQFNLIPDCNSPGPCGPGVPAPIAQQAPTSLQYIPGQVISPVAVPSCAAAAYEQAVAGCEQSSAYQCGVQAAAAGSSNKVDFTETQVPGNTSTGLQCLIHQTGGGTTGQDILDSTTVYPFQIRAGSNNPLVGTTGSNFITNSDSIMTVPIYDSSGPLLPGSNPNVTIVGILQVFVNQVDPVIVGGAAVTVLNVSGCGNGLNTTVGPTPLYGTSPVPVRLITPPSS
jgi:Flp pilus assembly protein TadG